MSTGRKCGLDASLRLIGSAVMSSRLLLRRDTGGRTFSFSDESGRFSASVQLPPTATSSSAALRLLDLRGMGIGCVDPLDGNVVAFVGCAFSVKGCFASSLISPRRRFLNGQIGILWCVQAKRFTFRPQTLWRAVG